MASQPAATRR